VVNPDKSQMVVDLAVAPAATGFPVAREGVPPGSRSGRTGSSSFPDRGHRGPYAQEYRELGPNEVVLREISELTGGGPLGEAKEAFTANRRRSRIATDLWPWLVGLVAVALVPEIAVRRIGPALGRWGRRLRGKGEVADA
jgi:hypothetical protein